MALFKIFNNIDIENGKTVRNSLPATTHKGYCYFDANTNLFYIDIKDSDGELSDIYDEEYRVALNGCEALYDSNGESISDNISEIKTDYVLTNSLEATFETYFSSTSSTDARKKTITLYAEQWIGKNYEIYVNTINDDVDVLVNPSQGSVLNYINSNIQCAEQSANTLKFVCDEVPTEDIEINILIIGILTETTTDITYANVFNTFNREFKGLAWTPEPIVKMGTTILTKNIDYTVSYEDNINIGVARMIIAGIGNYTGSKTVPFMIYTKHYITISNEEGLTLTAPEGKYWDGKIEYSIDTKNWNEWNGELISSNTNGQLYLRGINNTIISGNLTDKNDYGTWVLNGENISISGDIDNLLDYQTLANGGEPYMEIRCFKGMFMNNSQLIYIDKLILPKQIISYEGCMNMFDNCANLKTPAIMPATHIEDWGYSVMYSRCTSLNTLPELPALYLGADCYNGTFTYCSSLDFTEGAASSGQYNYYVPTSGTPYGTNTDDYVLVVYPIEEDGAIYYSWNYIYFNTQYHTTNKPITYEEVE